MITIIVPTIYFLVCRTTNIIIIYTNIIITMKMEFLIIIIFLCNYYYIDIKHFSFSVWKL